MKFKHREAQRSRERHQQEFLPRSGAVGTPQNIVSTETPQAPSGSGTEPANPALITRLQKFHHWFTTRSEPRITLITDQCGQTWWKAYNPRTQTLQWLESETEVMIWLDHQPDF